MKRILLFFCVFNISMQLYSQLDKIPAMTSFVFDGNKAANLNMLVNTKDFTNIFNPTRPDKYPTTVQLVHLERPFPPLWYQVGLKKIVATTTASDFYLGPFIQAKTGHLSYSFVVVPDSAHQPVFEGYVILDTVTMEPIDTLSRDDFTFDSIHQAIDNHEYEEDEHGNKLFLSVVKTFIDVRCLSGNAADSLMPAAVQYIVILDSLNQIKFLWNPLQFLSPCEMYWELRNASTTYPGMLNWSHANSVRWSNDGNILYSFRHIGIGKINSTTGEIMFKLGGKDTLNAIPLADSIGYAMQHDFFQRPDGYYSLFNNGSVNYLPYMDGLIYDIDEVNKTVRLVDRYRPNPDCISRALGGFDTYKDDLYVLNRGMHFCPATFDMVDIVNVSDKSYVAKMFSPSLNFSYRAYPTTWNISRRPKVYLMNDTLRTDSISGLYGYTWYKVTDTNAVKVDSGLAFKPSSNGQYVVEARAGNGSFTSYLISDVYDYFLTGIKNSAASQIAFHYDTMSKIASIDLKENRGNLRVYDLKGQLFLEKALSGHSQQVPFKAAKGIYIFEVTTPGEQFTAKVFVN